MTLLKLIRPASTPVETRNGPGSGLWALTEATSNAELARLIDKRLSKMRKGN